MFVRLSFRRAQHSWIKTIESGTFDNANNNTPE